MRDRLGRELATKKREMEAQHARDSQRLTAEQAAVDTDIAARRARLEAELEVCVNKR